MKKYFIVIFLMFFTGGIFLDSANALVQTSPKSLFISEIFLGSLDSANQEFVELYNPGLDEVSLAGWSLQYASALSLSWHNLAKLTFIENNVAPKSFYLLASANYLGDVADGTFAAGLSQTGGQLRVVDSDGNIVDRVSWGADASMALGSPATAPLAGQSLSRNFNGSEISDFGDNSKDFFVSVVPTPKASNNNTVNLNSDPSSSINQPTVDPSIDSQTVTIETVSQPSLEPLKLSEILPNPAAPASDTSDEFVEIYNPNSVSVNLNGYQFVAGSNDTYKWSIKPGSIEPDGYAVFYSRDTTLSLSNSGGRVRLIAPGGTQIDQSDSYPAAPKGQAWVKADNGWVWTTTPTPGSANIVTLPTDEDTTAVLATASGITGPYTDLEISELLPNPKSPQTDASDEFVELYNPTGETVNLSGYKLVAGLKGSYKYTFKNQTIGPNSYEAFYSRDTNLTLSNSGGKVILYAPDGTEIDETDAYGTASDGQAWIFAGGKWQWTASPTPGKANVLLLPAASVKAAKTNKETARKTKKTRASAIKNIAGNSSNLASNAPQHQNSLSPLLLAGVGGAALIYAGYEYRHDLANQYYKLRRYRDSRRETRQTS